MFHVKRYYTNIPYDNLHTKERQAGQCGDITHATCCIIFEVLSFTEPSSCTLPDNAVDFFCYTKHYVAVFMTLSSARASEDLLFQEC